MSVRVSCWMPQRLLGVEFIAILLALHVGSLVSQGLSEG